MGTIQLLNGRHDTHLLRFRSLFDDGRGLAFPCDDHGEVDMNTLSERARGNYLYARTVVGREFHSPRVERSGA
ncbi:hypothetical protein [Ideonella sp. YS5]|uniref:hypothetical protein n=1 Tax=Ideonella sp. YS5 TaxID=3453714 RepID=UPI003EEB12A8